MAKGYHSAIVFLALLLRHALAALPLQLLVNLRGTECLYDKLDEGESVTASVFILSGQALKATVRVDGPVASLESDSGNTLQAAVDEFEKGAPENSIVVEEVVDFEHLNMKDEFFDEDAASDDDELIKIQNKELSPEERINVSKTNNAKRFWSNDKNKNNSVSRNIKSFHQVTAEVEMRRESELGGLGEDGHVLTYEQKTMKDEDKLLEEDTASEEGIKDEDFHATRDKLRQLRRLLAEIHSQQQKERRRLIVHAATNKHSHSRMVLSSLMETVLFMAVTGYQVYTIRRWFRGAPALGR
ncbi:emp24/gp25L/p24 family/GOLD [Seminavis robusta]|uniref:Emp24/gp25L/p24 family/GOLD n=1 Tax=Seminavis robusta TaxID=568900 RepID=A0A9N8HK22_9STRA|nr:emp24/gp25L/p24 family/GOLD [Seminavis robusta]|eukprot:Sro587_g171410.1 emp24/gp25L/p24 family/GOLD (299) ;mRNA; f:57004-58098